MPFIFFNLLVNSILSLTIGLMLVYLSIWFFRVEIGSWKLYLLSLPFIKIIYDFSRGVPEKSVLFSGVDPFSLPPKHQVLSIGAGFDGWTPHVSTVFSVNAPDGNTYHSSIGDYFLIWTHRTLNHNGPMIIVLAVLAISLVLLTIRLTQYFSFERKRQEERSMFPRLKEALAGSRLVDIYISPNFSGTPFTGGVWNPYICLPEDATQRLNSEELNAVIAHEMGHVRRYDLIFTVLIQALGDLFWFIPGYRWLSRKIDGLREMIADDWALQSDTDPYVLASALLKLQEIPDSGESFVLYSAFFREKSLLRARVERLIGNVKERSPRFGWRNRWFRYALAFLITVTVLNSVFGGNFENETALKTPEALDQLLRVSCLCVK